MVAVGTLAVSTTCCLSLCNTFKFGAFATNLQILILCSPVPSGRDAPGPMAICKGEVIYFTFTARRVRCVTRGEGFLVCNDELKWPTSSDDTPARCPAPKDSHSRDPLPMPELPACCRSITTSWHTSRHQYSVHSIVAKGILFFRTDCRR